MMTIARFIKIMGVAVCLTMVTPVFADPAPVYDADNMQQDDNINIGADQSAADPSGADQSQYPPPPSPSVNASNQEGAFVPNQMPSPPPSSSLSVEQRIQRMEQQVSNMQNNDLSTRMESLQDQVQTLRGQVEELTHQLQQAQNQQKNVYADLDKRLSQKVATPSKPVNVAAATDDANSADDVIPPVPVAKPVRKGASAKSKVSATVLANNDKSSSKLTDGQPNVAEEQQIYQTAYNLIKAKKYAEAVTALQGMLKKYPSGQFASNAHYWLGELYGLMGKNDQALNEFNAVVKTFPDSPRVSDAQLKVGLIYASQTKWSDAKSAFKKVINQYPGTASARLASEQLKQIKLAGH